MDEYRYPPPPPPPPTDWGRPPEPSFWDRFKKLLAPLGVVALLLAKFAAKLKFLILPAVKFLPVILKTGGTMVLSIGLYAMYWGIWFALGFVLLIFVHECGHLLAARRLGLNVGAPVFIPFMGAFIALKDAPKNAWIESQVGIGGPMLGTLGAGICYLIYLFTDAPIFSALAYTGFFLNLFNLTPVGFLDGGRIVTALSPWLWVAGMGIVLSMLFMHPGSTSTFILVLILIASVPRIVSLFRGKTDDQRRFYEVTPAQRLTMGVMYFGLIALLFLGMHISHVSRETLQ